MVLAYKKIRFYIRFISLENCRRRGQRILIDSEEQDVKEEADSAEITGTKSVMTKPAEIITSEKKDIVVEARNTLLSPH